MDKYTQGDLPENTPEETTPVEAPKPGVENSWLIKALDTTGLIGTSYFNSKQTVVDSSKDNKSIILMIVGLVLITGVVFYFVKKKK